MEQTKSCTNCTRSPQALSQFEGKNGRPCNTCLKCREKGKKYDSTPERLEKHKKKQAEKGKIYSKNYRESDKTSQPVHNLEQKCAWAKNEKTVNRISKWKMLNVHDRIGSYKRCAKSKNLEWTLTDEEAGCMLNSACVYCGHDDMSIRLNGIDRLDQQGNYTNDNTVPCCWTCNFMKGCADPLTFIDQCKKIAQCTYIFPDVAVRPNIRPRKTTSAP
jgi:hypothetical protein